MSQTTTDDKLTVFNNVLINYVTKIGQTNQKEIKKNLKIFYKEIENIKIPLQILINTYKQIKATTINTAINIKGIVGQKHIFSKNTGATNEEKKLQESLNKFYKNWGEFEAFLAFYDTTDTLNYYNSLNYCILKIETEILLYYTKHNNIIDPDNTIDIKYNAALTALQGIHNLKTRELLKIVEKDAQTQFDSRLKIILDFLFYIKHYLEKYNYNNQNKIPTNTTTLTQNLTQTLPVAPQNLTINTIKEISKNIEDDYIRSLFKTKIPKKFEELNEIPNIKKTNIKNADDLTKIYRSLLKALFMIMEKYYYYDLKYKNKWSYKSLNNSYQKSKLGKLKKTGRFFTELGHSITTFGKYKSPVKLGRKYRINPTFGFTKGTNQGIGKKLFSYNIEDLEKHKKDLIEQIKKYQNIINTELYDATKKAPKENKDFEYYEVKQRLEKEVRKLKIIKFFLLRQTVRLKKRTFGKRPKLLNTIATLKAKIATRSNNVKKNKKRTAKLTKMIKAQTLINEIDEAIKINYKEKNNSNSKEIKKTINNSREKAKIAKREKNLAIVSVKTNAATQRAAAEATQRAAAEATHRAAAEVAQRAAADAAQRAAADATRQEAARQEAARQEVARQEAEQRASADAAQRASAEATQRASAEATQRELDAKKEVASTQNAQIVMTPISVPVNVDTLETLETKSPLITVAADVQNQLLQVVAPTYVEQTAEELAVNQAAEKLVANQAAEELVVNQAAEKLVANQAAEELATKQAAEKLVANQAAEELAAKQAAEELATKKAAEELAAKQAAEELAEKQAAEELAAKQVANLEKTNFNIIPSSSNINTALTLKPTANTNIPNNLPADGGSRKKSHSSSKKNSLSKKNKNKNKTKKNKTKNKNKKTNKTRKARKSRKTRHTQNTKH